MPTAAAQTVLFIGDSITHAHKRPEEVHDCYQLGSGYVASVAAELCSLDPSARHRFINNGECGYTVRDVLEQWTFDTAALDATIVSILIGINDANSAGHGPETFRDDYRRFLSAVRHRLPAVKWVLLEPFGVPVQPHPKVDVISPQQLRRLSMIQSTVRELAAATESLFVPLQHLFTEAPATAWTLDGIHPSAAAHWRIARAWTAAVRRAGWFPLTPGQGDNT